ncbi:hypothetical protein M3Y97_00065500 [Aphelenchoides bicaudatus]|nr:hypothetical protein M3Y97_00065500 [Aphelenchoides bicaudatus]
MECLKRLATDSAAEFGTSTINFLLRRRLSVLPSSRLDSFVSGRQKPAAGTQQIIMGMCCLDDDCSALYAEHVAVRSFRTTWPIKPHPDMLPESEVPILLRRSHVKSGYRPLNKSIRYYLASAFQWHNELVNVWTHLIPLIVLYIFWVMPELATERPRSSVLFSYAGVSTLFLCSALTHLMHSRSYLDHVFWLLIDFSGIALFSLSVGTTRFMCRAENSILFTSFYVPTLTSVILTQYLSTCGFFVLWPFWKTRHLIRIFTCGSVAFWIYVPLYDRYLQPQETDLSIMIHNRGFQWLLLSGIFMACNFPECCLPGKIRPCWIWTSVLSLMHSNGWILRLRSCSLDCPRRTDGPTGFLSDELLRPLSWVSALALFTCFSTVFVFLQIARKQKNVLISFVQVLYCCY